MRNYLIPRDKADLEFIENNGLKAWLTWCTFEQACGFQSLNWWQKLARRFYKCD